MRTNVTPLLLLDTHTWFWAVMGSLEEKSPEAVRAIRQASERNGVFVSAISLWELAMLEVRGRIKMRMEPLIWIKRALAAPGLELEELTPEVAVASARLSGSAPRDPSDRIMISTAMSLNAVLVSCDREIISYCEKLGLPHLGY